MGGADETLRVLHAWTERRSTRSLLVAARYRDPPSRKANSPSSQRAITFRLPFFTKARAIRGLILTNGLYIRDLSLELPLTS